jgi:polyol transport system substrate-binding protein
VHKPGKKLSVVVAGATAGILAMSGCSGAGSTGGGGSSGGGGDKTITALTWVPQMLGDLGTSIV